MTAADAYLDRVARALVGMDRRARHDILRELRSHLADAIADGGEAALANLDPPETLAARYKAIYGYGRPVQAAFVALAAALAIPTLPLLLFSDVGTPLAFSTTLVFLVVLVGYLMAVAVKAGAAIGLAAGVAACVARFAGVAAFGATAGVVVGDAVGWSLFTVVSLLLVAIGYLPGRARERWRPREILP